MTIVLEAVAANGGVQRLPMAAVGQTSVAVEPGYRYRLVDDAGGRVAVAPQVKRVGSDIVVDGLQDGRSVVLQDFFTRCTPDDACSLSLENLGGTASEVIVPSTQPVGAAPDGSFLMYAPPGTAASAALAEPASGFDLKPVIGVAGGLAIVGGAGGGGGGGGGSSDSTPPAPPTLTSGEFTRLASPVFAGTAEPGAKVTLTLFGAAPVTYETTSAVDGAWRIDTGADEPVRGTSFELAEGVQVPLSLLATDAAGNPSDIVAATITLDSVSLGAPTITSPLVTHDTTPVIAGTAEPGARITVGLDLDRDGTVDAAWSTTALASGEWSVDVGTAPTSGSLPGGQLANLSETRLVVTAFDDAGNSSAPTLAVLRIDASLPPVPTIDAVAGDNRVNAFEAGAAVTIRGTLPEADRPLTVSWGGASLPATVDGTSWSAVFSSAQIPPDGQRPVTATYESASGATSAQAVRTVLVDRIAPGAPAISAVPENGNGGINAAEASNGTVVHVALGGTGAVAGDRIVLSWGGATVTHTIGGSEVGGNIANVNVSASTIAAQGDGAVNLAARIVDLAGNEGPSSAAFTVTVDRSAPNATPTITAVRDDFGPITGPLSNGASTDDTSPRIEGSVSPLSAGNVVEVLRNGSPVGVATVSGSGWSFADSGLSDGSTYTYSARVVDGAGNRGATGNTFRISIDTDGSFPTGTLVDAEIRDNVRPRTGTVDDGDSTNDRTPTLRLTFEDVLDAGVAVRIFRATDSGSPVAVGFAEHERGRRYEFTDGPLDRGNTYTYTAELTVEGGASTALPLDYTIRVI